MANSKISALTAATTPVAGTETLPIVQGGVTKQVSIANLTAGRAVSAASLSLTTPLPTTSGGTGLSSFTQYGIVYASSTSALTTGSALTFSSPTVKLAATSANFYAEVPDGSGGGQALMKAGDAAGRYFAMRGTSYDYDPAFLTSGAASVTMKNLSGQATSMTWGSTGDITFNAGNLIQGTAAKGINFTANTPAAGMTSQLLNWYEEGTWTPTMTSASGTLTVTVSSGTYTRIGRFVQFCCSVTFDTDASVGTSDLTIGGLPFTVASGRPSFGNLTSSNFSLGDYGTGGAHGLVTVSAGATSFVHIVRTVNINSRTGCAWAYAGVYQV